MASISVIICTRNRASELRATLGAIGDVLIPDAWSLEILVVDNGSTDETRAVVAQAAGNNPSIRYLYDVRGGKSAALNYAVSVSSGEILLFTDDDIRPDPD